jgi:quercetin dioxygenase-like cupin family protein
LQKVNQSNSDIKMSHPRNLPLASNYITTNTPEGESVFAASEDAAYPKFKLIDRTEAVFADMHLSPTVPASLSPTTATYDLRATEEFITTNTKTASIPASGVGFRRTDMPPGSQTPMHRTLSVDYGTVVAGTVELTLGSGEKRMLRAGDTVVQRATMHQWRNPSETEWLRMVWVMLPIEPLEIDGNVLKEEWIIPEQPPTEA